MIKLAFVGKMASGKTELSQYFLDNYGGYRVAFADALKADVIKYRLTPDGEILKARDRSLLQNYGQLRRAEIANIDLMPQRILYNNQGKFIIEEMEPSVTFDLGKCYPEYWVDLAVAKALELSVTENVIIDDIRRANEAKALKDNGFTIVKIVASDETRKQRLNFRDGRFNERDLNNISESEVDKIPFDFGINNDRNDDTAKNELNRIVAIIK